MSCYIIIGQIMKAKQKESNEMREFNIKIYDRGNKGEVKIETNITDFKHWMMACEYLLHKTAQKSNLPYEEATKKLVQGAMTWKENPNE